MKRQIFSAVLSLGVSTALWAEPVPEVEYEDEFLAPESTVSVPVPAVPAPAVSETGPNLKVVHPPEGANLRFMKSSFVFGSVDPRAALKVNGRSVVPHSGGGWITMVPFAAGTNDILVEATLGGKTTQTVRRVSVAGPPGVPAVKPLNVSVVAPAGDMETRAGDVIAVTAVGSPGQDAWFQFENRKTRYPMAESAGAKGTYRGAYVVQPEDAFNDQSLRVTLALKNRPRESVSAEAKGKIWRLREDTPWVVEVSTDLAILRATPAPYPGEKGGYVMFPPPGTRLWVTGRRGEELRVRLSGAREAWIGTEEVRFLPAGTPPPRTVTGAVSVEAAGRHTQVRLGLGQKVPFEVRLREDGTGVDVLLFGALSNTDWVHYNAPDGAVTRVDWIQEDGDTFRLQVRTRPDRWWGYDARYENSNFVLELRRPPAGSKNFPLENLRVVVDAGHSWDIGARGPTGLLEKDANLAIAQCLEKKLKGEKAEVVMLRTGSENVALYDRPKLAWAAQGDVLLSVHNNALPDGANPFERNGFGVYYYHRQSQSLAESIHAAYRDIFGRPARGRPDPLRDDGLHYGNLALPRTPQMPSVLTESAYVIWPPEEALLKTETFQCDCAEAMVRGLKRFVNDFRGRGAW